MFVPEVAPLRCIYTLELRRVIESSCENTPVRVFSSKGFCSAHCNQQCLSLSAVSPCCSALPWGCGTAGCWGQAPVHPLHLCFMLGWHDLLDGVLLLEHVSTPACFDRKRVELLKQSSAVCPHFHLYCPSYAVLSRHSSWCCGNKCQVKVAVGWKGSSGHQDWDLGYWQSKKSKTLTFLFCFIVVVSCSVECLGIFIITGFTCDSWGIYLGFTCDNWGMAVCEADRITNTFCQLSSEGLRR